MGTNLKEPGEFHHYLKVIWHDLWDANTHFHIFKGLGQSVPEYANVFEYAPWFWSYTSRAHIEVAVLHLCRVYDQHSSAIHLRHLVEIVQDPANAHIFCQEAFLRRIGDNENREDLARAFGAPDPQQICHALQFCSEENPLVDNLKQMRDNVLAHRNAGMVATERDSKLIVPFADIESLIDKGFEILNLCGGWFSARNYSLLPPSKGERDFMWVIQTLQNVIATREATDAALDQRAASLTRQDEHDQ